MLTKMPHVMYHLVVLKMLRYSRSNPQPEFKDALSAFPCENKYSFLKFYETIGKQILLNNNFFSLQG